jgi:hypothetical protein
MSVYDYLNIDKGCIKYDGIAKKIFKRRNFQDFR